MLEIIDRDKLAEISLMERIQINRSVMIANATGVIATLSFIGARVSTTSGEGFGVFIFLILVGFIVGLFVSWFALICGWSSRQKQLSIAESGMEDDLWNALVASRKTAAILTLGSLVLFVVSVSLGLSYLWTLA